MTAIAKATPKPKKRGRIQLRVFVRTESGKRTTRKHQEGAWYYKAKSTEATDYWAQVLSNLTGQDIANQAASIRMEMAKGLKKEHFEAIAEVAGVPQSRLADVIHVNVRNLNRRGTLTETESERLLRIGAAFQKALEVFGDAEKARKWFISPKGVLDGHAPLEYCSTELGAQEVGDLLVRVQYGVYS
jgi:putative toxin-antitoxin system antitoxin component (TIGR02293 family)